ncbi:MAG TPA: N-methyl-L-tryptophan oxidase [Gemmatimonadaceae bacterium]|nr:N-methyl-L-tryptophan oxidase [Gemmatimonadaceae bacterium]
MAPSFDVAIVGLGAMGSAAALHLARRGLRVVGLDRWHPPHPHGSTHGRTRIIREAYYEHPVYVPLVQRAYALWEALEREAGRRLFIRTGGAMAGPADGVLVAGALRSAREHGLIHELVDAAELRRRFPALAPESTWVAVVEPRAGLLLPEACVEAHLGLAREAGADLRFGTRVTSWDAGGNGVRLTTESGALDAARLLLAAGPWLPALAAPLALPLAVERQTFHWMRPAARPELCRADRCPIALWEYAPGRLFATFPDVGDGVKCGVHHEGELVPDPDAVRRRIDEAETAATRALLRTVMPEADGTLLDRAVCLYTNTPDHDFLIDAHPDHPHVIIASPCSGHGFKFSSAIGELLADLLTDVEPRFDLAPFRLTRPTLAAAPA